MDQVLTGSLDVLLDAGLSDHRRFFTALDEVQQDLDREGRAGDFDAFRAAFATRADRDGFAEAGERFTRYLADNGGGDTVRKLAAEGGDNLATEFARIVADARDEPGPEADDGYDEAGWTAFVTEFGAGWNGEDETWPAFVEWFRFHAEERGLAGPAGGFLEYATGESDRIAFFATYGVTITRPDPDEDDGDPAVWEAFLAEFGPAWNGEASTWDDFVPYFQFYAEERAVVGFARAFLANAPDDNTDRIAYFANYGITVEPSGEEPADADEPGPDEPDAGEPGANPVDAARAEAEFRAVVTAAAEVGLDDEDALADAFAELVAEMPEAAALSPEQMRELLATIPAEHL